MPALRGQEPFVAVGGEIVDVHGPHIDGEHAERLDCVEAEEFAVFAAGFSDQADVVALAGGVFDVGKSNQARARMRNLLENAFEWNCRRR